MRRKACGAFEAAEGRTARRVTGGIRMRRVKLALSTVLAVALTLATTAIAFADGGGVPWAPR